jgi:predicted MPP superfamily phosphohydrolase
MNISRRKFLGLSALATAAVAAPVPIATGIRVTQLRLGNAVRSRFVHFSDFHYAGDADFAAEAVARINALKPDFACFTGDLVEKREHLAGALDWIRQIQTPVFGVPGNHDYACGAPFSEFENAFAATGGGWLANRNITLAEPAIELVGMDVTGFREMTQRDGLRHLLLMHYPDMANHLASRRYDLILAGHSHGGQIRLPLVGPLVLPTGVGAYDYGHYATPAGPLYVSAGLGMLSSLPLRVNCPPELTLITI